MRKAASTALLGFLTTLVLTSSAVLAAEIDVSIDKNTVAAGGVITVTGTITSDDGETGEFDYRVAAIVPGQRHGGDRVIICDSGRQTTGADGAVSFDCDIPTLDELGELGLENAEDRAVIPIKGGIIARDSATNETVKKSGKALIVNTDKFKEKFEAALERIDSFITHAEDVVSKCDNIILRAEESGLENTVDRCGKVQEKMQEKIDDALAAQERINSALTNLEDLSDFSFDDLKNSFVNFKRGGTEFRVDVKGIKDHVADVRADLEKRVAKEIADKAKDRAKEVRDKIRDEQKRLDERLKDLRNARADRVADSDKESSSDEEESTESDSEDRSGSSDSDKSETDSDSDSSGSSDSESESDNSGSGGSN